MTDIETDNEFPNQNSSSDEEVDIGLGNSEPDPTIGMERVNFTLKKAPILPPPPALVEPEQDVDETDDTISIAETEVSVATTVAIDTQLRKIIHKNDTKKDKKKKSRRKSRSPPPATKFGSTTMPSIPAIVPKPTKEIFGKDLKDKVVREETPLRDDGNMSDARFMILLACFKNA